MHYCTNKKTIKFKKIGFDTLRISMFVCICNYLWVDFVLSVCVCVCVCVCANTQIKGFAEVAHTLYNSNQKLYSFKMKNICQNFDTLL